MTRRAASDPQFRTTLILMIGACFVSASPSQDTSPSLSSKVAQAISSEAKAKSPALVRIESGAGVFQTGGTGFRIDPNGTICTLRDFIGNGGVISVTDGDRKIPASLVAVDQSTGLAFLKTEGSAPSFIAPFPSVTLAEGTPVLSLGLDSGSSSVARPSLGIAGVTIDHDEEHFFPVRLTRATLPSAKSGPGAPVMDLSGKFAGIVLREDPSSDTCMILPASAVAKLHEDLLRFGKPNPGWIGIAVEEAAVPRGNSRTRVAAVERGSPADRAAIRPGDFLLSIGGRQVLQPQEVLDASFYLTAGDQVSVSLIHDGTSKRVSLRCSEPPAVLLSGNQN
jgi:S1-C subfamily serine protease